MFNLEVLLLYHPHTKKPFARLKKKWIENNDMRLLQFTWPNSCHKDDDYQILFTNRSS